MSTQSTGTKRLAERRQTTQKVASVKGDSVQQSGSGRKRGKRRGATAGPSSASAPSGRQLLPFRGFTREYAEAHLKTVREAIRRKEIMINLLKSGVLTEKQLDSILPASCKSEATCL